MTDMLKEIRAEGDGAEIVREAKSAAVHRTTYTLDGRGAEKLALRNAKLSKHILALVDYIEAMGGAVRLSASEAAGYAYPGEDQATLRQAFCDGAVYSQTGALPTPPTEKDKA